MVARIEEVTQMSSILHYNEQKVLSAKASLIDCCNFPLPLQQITSSFYQSYLKHRNNLNLRSQVKSLHIMLSFSPDQTNLSLEQLRGLSREYMALIGFRDQPHLTYQHMDTTVPHLHIVTTAIDSNGNRINTSNLWKRLSLPAVEILVEKHNLHRTPNHLDLTQLDKKRPTRLQYGTSATKHRMEHIIRFVQKRYCLTHLAEWNAVLASYGIRAVTLAKKSTAAHPGLLYFSIDSQNKNIGTGILASQLKTKPTYRNLERLFKMNSFRISARSRETRIQLSLLLSNHQISDEQLNSELSKRGIGIYHAPVQDGESKVMLVDHVHHCVLSSLSQGLAKEAYQQIASASKRLQGPDDPCDRNITELKTTTEKAYRKRF